MRVVADLGVVRDLLLRRGTGDFGQDSPLVRERVQALFGEGASAEEAVRRIVKDVRHRGDDALREWTRKIDGVSLSRLEVSPQELADARRQVDEGLLSALTLAAERIRSFHELQRRHLATEFREAGLGVVVRPLERVGAYVPGGRASYPSTVLMTAIPARVAGVGDVVLATPPRPDASVSPATLVAADLAGVSRVFKVGGAQAIAALAFGTETVPRVDKVCGPGNVFVVLAKKLVFGAVAIDGLHGPTETLIIADDSADPAHCAADLLAQAEHDESASAILLATSPELARRVREEIEGQLPGLERADVARRSLEENGLIAVVPGVREAIEVANRYAPEHLCLLVRDADSYLGEIRNAGGIFLGSPEALGDYVAGPSHVMPTGGTARFSSPLGVYDFLKFSSLVALGDEEMGSLGPAAAAIARAEGLTGHARAVERRLSPGASGSGR